MRPVNLKIAVLLASHCILLVRSRGVKQEVSRLQGTVLDCSFLTPLIWARCLTGCGISRGTELSDFCWHRTEYGEKGLLPAGLLLTPLLLRLEPCESLARRSTCRVRLT
jgi:hypothetical protein